jgi:hypothetical protein
VTPPRIIKHGDAVSVNSNETSPGMDVLQAKVDLAEAKLALAQAKEEASSHSSSRSFGSSKTAADRRPELPLQTSVLRASSISPPPMKVVKCPPSPKPDSIDENNDDNPLHFAPVETAPLSKFQPKVEEAKQVTVAQEAEHHDMRSTSASSSRRSKAVVHDADCALIRQEELALQHALIEAENALRAREVRSVSEMRAQFAKERTSADNYVFEQLKMLEKARTTHMSLLAESGNVANQQLQEKNKDFTEEIRKSELQFEARQLETAEAIKDFENTVVAQVNVETADFARGKALQHMELFESEERAEHYIHLERCWID